MGSIIYREGKHAYVWSDSHLDLHPVLHAPIHRVDDRVDTSHRIQLRVSLAGACKRPQLCGDFPVGVVVGAAVVGFRMIH